VPVVPFTPRNFSEPVLDFFQVEHEIVTPQRGPLADGCRLGRLQVREGQTGQLAVSFGEHRQLVDDRHELRNDESQGVADLDQLGVVGDEAARRPEVDDAPRRRAAVAERMGVGHHVVPEPAFVVGGGGKVDVVHSRPHLGDLCIGNVQPELAFRLRQRDPQPPPGGMFGLRGPEAAHRVGGVAGDEGVFVARVVWYRVVLQCSPNPCCFVLE